MSTPWPRFDLHAWAEWQRTLSRSGAIDASFTGIDASAPIALDLFGRTAAAFGAGFAASWTNASLSLDLDARQAGGRDDLGTTLNWRWSF